VRPWLEVGAALETGVDIGVLVGVETAGTGVGEGPGQTVVDSQPFVEFLSQS